MNVLDIELAVWFIVTLSGTVASLFTLHLMIRLLNIQRLSEHFNEVIAMVQHNMYSECVRFINHLLYFLLGVWVIGHQIIPDVVPSVNGFLVLFLIVGYSAFAFNTITEFIVSNKLYQLHQRKK